MNFKVLFFYNGLDILGGPRNYESEVVSSETTSEAAQAAAKEAFFRDLDPWKRRSIRSCEVYDANRNLLWKWDEAESFNQTVLKTGWKVVRQRPRPFIPLKLEENGRWVRNGPPYVPEKR